MKKGVWLALFLALLAACLPPLPQDRQAALLVTTTPTPTRALGTITPGPAQPSTQAIKSTFTPYVLPTRAPATMTPRGTLVIPRVAPPTLFITFTPGPGGRSAPGFIVMTPTAGPSPRPTATPFPITGKQPPACTFPLAQTTTADSAPATYTFSDAKSVRLVSGWGDVRLYQWLPDNQRLLVGHKDNVDWDNPDRDDPPQIISLYNPRTGESQDFGSRVTSAYPPPAVWIPSLKAVVYPESLDLTPYALRSDGQGWVAVGPAEFQRRLWLSQGDPTHVRTLVDERVKSGAQLVVAASPDGSEIVYLDEAGRQLYVQRVAQGALQGVPSPAFDATQWGYRGGYAGWYMTWRPNSTQVFLYSSHSSSYTFLLHATSGQMCELNLWTDDPRDWYRSLSLDVHWSPNGRYLAVARERGSIPIDLSELIVLDTATGQRYRMDATQFSPAGLPKEGIHSVGDLAWAPDNRHLAAIGGVSYCTVGCIDYETPSAARLFLVDFLTGQPVQISSAELRTIGQWPSEGLLWSSDGSQLIVPVVYGPYLLSVQKRAQP